MDWKGVTEKIIVAVVAGAILGGAGWLLGRATAPESPNVRAELSWVTVPNPFYPVQDSQIADIDRILGARGIADVLRRIGGEMRVGVIKIKNTSSIRIEKVELRVEGDGVLLWANMAKDVPVTPSVMVAPIDGSADATFTVIAPSSYYKAQPVKVIYAGRNIQIAQNLSTGGFPFAFAQDYEVPIGILLVLAILSLIVVIIAILVSVASYFWPDLALKGMTPAQVQKMISQLEQIKLKYPEKLPKAPPVLPSPG